MSAISALSISIAVPLNAYAQQRPMNDQEAAAACAACSGVGLVVFIGVIALNIAMLVWVARDAKSRGMDGAAMWMILVMVTGVVGLIIYILSRPKGELAECGTCHNKRLQASAKCPHCGNP
jgi:hypothetical protein